MALKTQPNQTATNKPLEQAAGWLNLTIIDSEGNQVEEIGGFPLKDSNPIHAAINAAGGEIEDGYYIHIKWNSGVPKKPKADLSQIFKRKG